LSATLGALLLAQGQARAGLSLAARQALTQAALRFAGGSTFGIAPKLVGSANAVLGNTAKTLWWKLAAGLIMVSVVVGTLAQPGGADQDAPAAQAPGAPAAAEQQAADAGIGRATLRGEPLPPGALRRLGTARLRHVATGKEIHPTGGHQLDVPAVAFAPGRQDDRLGK
jgi:hypothetical protein